MLSTSIRVVARALRRHPGYTGLNVAGLAVGLTACLLMGLYVRYEWTVDDVHANADRLVRLNKRVTPQAGGTEFHAITSGQMGPTLAAEMPEVEQAIRVLPWFDAMHVQRGDMEVEVADVLFADAAFFSTLGFTLRHGDPSTVLDAPRSIVLTESTAQRLFGTADPVGQTVEADGAMYTVTGVAHDPPQQTHLPFNAVISWSTTVPGNGALEYGWLNNWITQVTYTYLLVAPDADRAALDAKLPAFMERYLPERAAHDRLYLQPFSDIYLGSSQLRFTRGLRLGNRTYVVAFSIVALLVLGIACINFTNLATARAVRRAREVGIRKTLGARPGQLTRQFLLEALLMSVGATAIAVAAARGLLPAFRSVVDRPLQMDVLHDPILQVGIVGMALVTGMLAGLYPALVLARYHPTQALKGVVDARHASTVRQGLVTMQFAAAIALIAGTMIVYQQVRYAQTKDLGFDAEQVVTLAAGGTAIPDQYAAFEEEALRHPGITHVAASETAPGQGTQSFEIHPEGRSEGANWQAHAIRLGDPEFLETYGIRLLAGRSFSAARGQDSLRALVVNEALVRAIGWTPDEAVGRRMHIEGEVANGRVIGVMENFHLQSLRQAIEPVVVWMDDRRTTVSVRLARAEALAAMDHLRQTWAQFEAAPFAYTFLSASFARYVEEERRLMQLLGAFAGLALGVACLGLFGLAAYAAQRRQKEIGIRKAIGASIGSIVQLLSREYVVLVGVAFAVAAPVAYLAMEAWLQHFAYRIDVAPSVLVGAGALTLLVALTTVGLQAARAARTDPARVLRSE
jgi:putative ABC transport system permease protein